MNEEYKTNAFYKANKELIGSFYEANKELIGSLKEGSSIRKYLNDLLLSYEENKAFFLYAEVQLGLAKALDFQVEDEKLKTLIPKIENIVTLALQILQIQRKPCSITHEDGACQIAFLNYSRGLSDLTSQGWPPLPWVHALSFSGKIIPRTILTGTVIYRIIGGTSKGAWWLENKPTDRKNWRSDSAVSDQWNDGSRCVEMVIDEPLQVWKGVAATQAVPNSPENCYLKGGGCQIWLDPSAIKDFKPNEYPWL